MKSVVYGQEANARRAKNPFLKEITYGHPIYFDDFWNDRTRAAYNHPDKVKDFLQHEDKRGGVYRFFRSVMNRCEVDRSADKKIARVLLVQGFEYNPDLVGAYCIEYPKMLAFIRDLQTPEFVEHVVFSLDTHHYATFFDVFRTIENPSYAVIDFALTVDSTCVKLLHNPTEENFWTVLQSNPEALFYIPAESRTDQMVRFAINRRPSVVRMLPTTYPLLEEMQLLAVSLDLEALPTNILEADYTSQKVRDKLRDRCIETGYLTDGYMLGLDMSKRDWQELFSNMSCADTSKLAFVFSRLDLDTQLNVAQGWKVPLSLACSPELAGAYLLEAKLGDYKEGKPTQRDIVDYMITIIKVTKESDRVTLLKTFVTGCAPDIVALLFQQDGTLLRYLPVELQTEEICYAAITHTPGAIAWCTVLSPRMIASTYGG